MSQENVEVVCSTVWASCHTEAMLTAFGVSALTFMMLMYALERRGPGYTAAFACGCALASTYGFLSGAWPFGVVEAIWTVVAVQRYRVRRSAGPSSQALEAAGLSE